MVAVLNFQLQILLFNSSYGFSWCRVQVHCCWSRKHTIHLVTLNIFMKSSLYKRLDRNELNIPKGGPLQGENGEHMPFVIVDDEAFALSENVLRPYPHRNLSIAKRISNYILTRARRMVDWAFGILCNKWRILHRAISLHPDFAYGSCYTEPDPIAVLSPSNFWLSARNKRVAAAISNALGHRICLRITRRSDRVTTLSAVCPDCCVVLCRFWHQCSHGLTVVLHTPIGLREKRWSTWCVSTIHHDNLIITQLLTRLVYMFIRSVKINAFMSY
jgi:hypothetical protein